MALDNLNLVGRWRASAAITLDVLHRRHRDEAVTFS